MSTLPCRCLPLLWRSYATAAAGAKTPSITPAPSIVTPVSSVQAGAALHNINYIKARKDPVALADNEYPDWLWKALDASSSSAAAEGEDVGDLYSKSKKSRLLAKKRAAKLALKEAANPEKKVPITSQTVDMPYATGEQRVGRGRVVAAIGPLKGGKTTVEIGGEGGVTVTEKMALQAREELKKAMRKSGRAKIKEANFLSRM